MNWNNWLRQAHRWLGIVFTATVISCIVVVNRDDPAEWVFYLPLLPLALQLLTGLYLFAVPYFTKWRGGRRPAPQA